jgi:methylmalonyl-CoA mutase cobalamin-binding domain/chain
VKRPYKVLFASDTAGHTAGYYVVSRAFRDAGFEVVLVNQLMPKEAATAALDEGADILAYRVMDRDPIVMGEEILRKLEELGVSDLPVLMGGIMSQRDAKQLRSLGIAGVFPPGSKLSDIVATAYRCVGSEEVE